jgi:uncharacterized iron-regulated membrane protein
LPQRRKVATVELALLLFTLLCPLSMVGLMGWWAWSMRRTGKRGGVAQAPVRSAIEENEITRMRAQLDQLEAQARDETSPAAG